MLILYSIFIAFIVYNYNGDSIKKFIFILVSTFVIPLVPSFIVGSSVLGLVLPVVYPPGFVFPIVWSFLYLLMSISMYIVSSYNDNLFLLYYIQLVLNALWSVIFFGFGLRLFGFIWILLLFFVVFFMFVKFYNISRFSGYFIIPYLVWLGFAGYLNLVIYLLNH